MSHTEIQGERLTIYCCQSDRHGSKALYERLVELAMREEMAGATALTATLGYGQHRRVHTEHLLTLADDLPIVVQIVDAADRIDAYLDAAGEALRGYTYIREKVRWHRPNT